jgi:hypothetical protein
MATCQPQIDCVLNSITETKRVVFFVGAGISVSAGYPLWKDASQAALRLARDMGLRPGAAGHAAEELGDDKYYEFFEILKTGLTKPAYSGIATRVFGGENRASEIHRALVRIGSRGIITTNFDECLISACVLERGGPPMQDIRVVMASDNYFVVKPHGSILVPDSMVLSTSDWKRVEADRQLRDFIAQTVTDNQIVFLGYGLGDPDFRHAWDDVLSERVFRAPAIYCCPRGSLTAARNEELREKNVQVVEFADDGSFAFVPKLLAALQSRGSELPKVLLAPTSRQTTQELERYVLLCLQFSPTQSSRLVLVCKAIVLEHIASAGSCTLSEREVLAHGRDTLGQDSEPVRDAMRAALAELVTSRFISRDGDTISFDPEVVKRLNENVVKAETAECDWVARALREQANELAVQVEVDDERHVAAVLDDVLLAVGTEVAELLLFSRPPKGDLDRVEGIVEEYCSKKQIVEKARLYRKTLKRLLFDPGEKDEDLLFKRLQAYFITSAYVLNPTSEKLLADYARDHWVYLDSSIILPAIAMGHPANGVYKRLLHRTHALGMKLKVLRDMLNEVQANVRSARKALREFRNTGVEIREVLRGYVALNGTGNGNVFLEGYVNQLDRDPALTPESYMAMIFGPDGGSSESGIEQALGALYQIERDDLTPEESDTRKLADITSSIEHLRKQGGRFKTRLLCEHEARQFYVVHLRREQNPSLATKIWFVTTDHFLTELQRLERERYPLPMSYTPRTWFQYLDLIDSETRGSRHFARLQPKMRFGVVTGDLGIEAIRTILAEQKALIEKGVVSVKELAEAAVKDYHVRHSIAKYDREVGSRRDDDLNPAKERVRKEMSEAVRQFVAVRSQELELLHSEKKAAIDHATKLEKQLAKEEHLVRTLKRQAKPSKRRRRRK